MQGGLGAIRWDLRDDAGGRVSTGVYLLRLEASREVISRKVVVLP